MGPPLAAPVIGRAARGEVPEVVVIISIVGIIGNVETCVRVSARISPREPSEPRNAFLVRFEHAIKPAFWMRGARRPLGCLLATQFGNSFGKDHIALVKPYRNRTMMYPEDLTRNADPAK